jgi:hypothetical protein
MCLRESYQCHYSVLGYHSNELSIINTLLELELCNTSETSEHSFVYCVSSVCSADMHYNHKRLFLNINTLFRKQTLSS